MLQTLRGARASVSGWVRKLARGTDPPRVAPARDAERAPETEQTTPRSGRALAEQIPAVTYVLEVGRPSRAIYYSKQVETLLGYPVDAYESNPRFWTEVVHPDDRERVLLADAKSASTGEPFDLEYRCRTSDGRTVWVHDKAAITLDERGRPRFRQGVILDITSRKAFEKQLEHRAFHDPLTDLPNRALFMDRLRHTLAGLHRSHRTIAVFFMDVDDFKAVNDSFGHETGDQLLISIAGRLRSCVRPGDTVSRIGGDEFAMLLENVSDARGAARVAQRVVSELRVPFDLDGREVAVGVSIGISLGVTARRPEDLLKEADVALYEAKRRGKSHYQIFDAGDGDARPVHSVSEGELRRALENGGLRVHYQPKIALRSGTVAGVEALVRWEHPERGLLTPNEFIPLAEETGLLEHVDRWVLREACTQMAAWQERFPRLYLTISVNLSVQSLRDQDLPANIVGILRDTGLDASNLVLEVPESAAIEPGELAVLGELKAMGVRLEFEDFGPGELSLPRLGRLPADSLKVDLSSARGSERQSRRTLAASALVGVAHALGREVVAEGVESGEQLARLRELGVERAQGRYLVGSVPGEEISSLLARCHASL